MRKKDLDIDKSRLMALSDGIIAIAATIMVLELSVPDELSIGALLEMRYILIAYLISFSLIYTSWYMHHRIFKQVERIGRALFLLNGAWIFFVCMIPFVTGVIGRFPSSRLSSLIYVTTLALWGLFLWLLHRKARSTNETIDWNLFPNRLTMFLFIAGGIVAIVSAVFFPGATIYVVGALSITMLILFR